MTTVRAEIAVDHARARGVVDPRVYGQFIEHVGRAVYGGVFEPGSPLADADGYRLDVLEACRELAPTVLRWPGGNFASGYHWRDGIGAVAERPTRRDLAWNAIESNAFGTEEFLELCRRLEAEPYLNLNVSTGSVDEAIGWVEYCDAVDPLPKGRAARAGPHPEPHAVPIWGLGNENYGWWQHGHTTASGYAETAREWAKLLRWADPSISLVAVGAPDQDWNWTVLRETARFVDYLSLHFYWHGNDTDPYHSILAGPLASELDIVAGFGMAAAAARRHELRQPIRIAVDEWGVWCRTNRPLNEPVDVSTLMRQGLSARSGIDTRFEEDYDLKDALAVATWLHVLWRHPEKIGLTTQAQMVNVIAPVHTSAESVVRHSVFWPVALARALAGPVALDIAVRCDEEVSAPGLPDGAMPAIDVAGTTDPSTGLVHLSVVNRCRDEAVELVVRGVEGACRLVRLWHENPLAGNTLESPDVVAPTEEVVEIGSRPLVLPPHSHTTLVMNG